jgi:serine/threonine protein kinase
MYPVPTAGQPLAPFVANAAFKRFKLNGRPSDKQMHQFGEEIRYMANLHHENLLTVKGVCIGTESVAEQDNCTCDICASTLALMHLASLMLVCRMGLITDLMDGSLDKLVHHVSEHGSGLFYCRPGAVHTIVLKIAKGLAHMHELKIIHRDIKAANVLISHDLVQVKVADFGVSRIMNIVPTAMSVQGSPVFMAPEVALNFFRKDLKAQYGTEVDVWSFGMLIYEMVTGLLPFAETGGQFLDEAFWESVYQGRRPVITAKQQARLDLDPELRGWI